MAVRDDNGLRAVLKRDTDDLHAQAEAAMDLPRRLQDRETYVDLLCKLWWLHAAQRGCSSDTVDARMAWLAEDIAVLGGCLPATPEAAPSMEPAGQLGVRYVVEGSSLGGRVILKQAVRALGVTSASGARFFHGHGADTGRRWAVFVAEVDAAPPGWRNACVLGAQGTFARFIAVLRSAH